MAANPEIGILLLRYYFLGESSSTPGTFYLSLHTAEPNWSGSNEVSGGGYERMAVDFEVDGNLLINSNSIEFEDMPGIDDPQKVSHIMIWTQKTGGTAVWRAAIQNPLSIPEGFTCRFKEGVMSIGIGADS